MITSYAERLLEESWIISSEILKEATGNNPLSNNLCSALGHDSLDELYEVVLDFGLAHLGGNLQEDFAELHVPIDVANGVMETIGRDLLLGGNEGVKLRLLRQWRVDEISSIERVENGS